MKKLTWKYGEKYAPLVFMATGAIYIFVFVVAAIICFYSFYFNMFFNFMVLT